MDQTTNPYISSGTGIAFLAWASVVLCVGLFVGVSIVVAVLSTRSAPSIDDTLPRLRWDDVR